MTKRKSYASIVNAPQPQTVQTDERQVKNDAGGYVFQADLWTRLQRFLVLGTESDSYYVGAEQKTFEAYKVIQDCLKADGFRTVDMAVTCSQEVTAPKNDPALWVMSMACSPKYASEEVVKYALERMRFVARTLSFLYQFIGMVQQSRGWGRGLRNAVAGWFDQMGFHGSAYQAVKYRQRNGWSGGDVLRLAHPRFNVIELNAIFRWLTNGEGGLGERKVKRIAKTKTYEQDYPAVGAALPTIIRAYEALQAMQAAGKVLPTGDWDEGEPSQNPLLQMQGVRDPVVQGKTVVDEAIRLIGKYDLTWEMLPTQLLNEKAVWEALIPNMPYTALMRNLAKMTRTNVFANREMLTLVCNHLTDQDAIVKARIHPINILAANMTYAQGKGMRGSETWTPERRITEALDKAFPLAFKAIVPTGQRILVAIDVSGSMGAKVNGMEYLSCSQAATALAVSILGSEPDADSMLFHTAPIISQLSPRNTLASSMQYIASVPSAGTDCGVPFTWAIGRLDAGQIDRMYDAVIILTDTQTWAGVGAHGHCYRAIEAARKRNPKMRVVEVALEANKFTLEPENPLTLRIAGLDSSAPKLINEFLRGNV